MKRIKLSFERGGELLANLNDRAPNTVKSLLDILPIETNVVHTRWCGREFSLGIKTNERPPHENCSNIVSKFDIAYWREWEQGSQVSEAPSEEAIAVYYGPEMLRYHNGILRVNIIGRILWEQEELLEEIGMRIWMQGIEKIRMDCDS